MALPCYSCHLSSRTRLPALAIVTTRDGQPASRIAAPFRGSCPTLASLPRRLTPSSIRGGWGVGSPTAGCWGCRARAKSFGRDSGLVQDRDGRGLVTSGRRVSRRERREQSGGGAAAGGEHNPRTSARSPTTPPLVSRNPKPQNLKPETLNPKVVHKGAGGSPPHSLDTPLRPHP